jgi:hypothetical protein
MGCLQFIPVADTSQFIWRQLLFAGNDNCKKVLLNLPFVQQKRQAGC